MIGGYVLSSRNPRFEDVCRRTSHIRLKEFLLEGGGHVAWFFHTADDNDSQNVHNNAHYDGGNLLLIDGLAVTRNSSAEYRLFDSSSDFSPAGPAAFVKCIDRIVSGVNAIHVSVDEKGIAVSFASNRASPGRIWYAHPSDGRGIVMCDDFRLMMELNHSEIEPKAIYAILKYGVSPDPLTIIRHIRSIPPSHFGTFNSEGSMVDVQPFFRFDFPGIHDCDLDFARSLLRNSAHFLRSMNPMILLSGGVDSTLFVHYLGQGVDKTNAFFLSFGTDDPQLPFAKEAARETGVNLEVVYMGEKDALSSIEKAPSSYMHPFSDYSTIPTHHLIDKIRQAHPSGGILVDGTGADACFGLAALEKQRVYSLAHSLPKCAKETCAIIYDRFGVHKSNSRMAALLEILAISNTDLQLYPLLHCRIDSFFSEGARCYASDVDSAFLSVFRSCKEGGKENDYMGAKHTIGDILTGCRAPALKDFHVGNEPFIETVYPFVWKDILLEQGNLSWNCKIKSGTAKWPLKKLLEEYMPHEFVYRKKSGFEPPFLRWLRQGDIYDLTRDTLLNPKAFVSDVISREKVREVMDDLPRRRFAPGNSVLNFLWGALFTELWLQENYRPDRHDEQA